MRNTLLCLLLCAFCAGCLPEDERITPHEPGSLNQASVSMGSDYRTQVYYDLESAKMVASASKMDWDLAFDASAEGVTIWLNTGRLMQAAPTTASDFSLVPVLADLAFRPDAPDGHANKTALAGWENDMGRVWVIDRGYTIAGLPIPAMKVRLLDVDSTAYSLEMAPLSATTAAASWVIPKRAGYNRVYFSMDGQGSIRDIEPRQDAWDIHFTQYTERLFDGSDTIPYLVTGVLLNPYLVTAALDSLLDFEAIDRNLATTLPYSSAANTIGYSWKYFNFDTGTFLVDPTLTYLIQSTEGLLFKLRFTDFYDQNGVKGHPLFEFQRL
jgi:hypothetical protein